MILHFRIIDLEEVIKRRNNDKLNLLRPWWPDFSMSENA